MFVLDPVRDSHLEKEVAEFYSEKLPYHNFEHVLKSLEYADAILRRCLDQGVKTDIEVVYFAILFHDAGYEQNHEKLGFETKEAYSVELTKKFLHSRAVSSHKIKRVCECIDGTEKDGNFLTVEAKIVRAADLAGMASSYEIFLENAVRLWKEVEILSGHLPSWESWKASVKERVEFYLSQKIEITPGDSSGAFHEGTRKNLERFLKEPEAPLKS